jgi:hypothetical protein
MKPIVFPTHALERMTLRGASEFEIRETIKLGQVSTVRSGRFMSKMRFEYHSISPVNHKHYTHKIVEAIWWTNRTKS